MSYLRLNTRAARKGRNWKARKAIMERGYARDLAKRIADQVRPTRKR